MNITWENLIEIIKRMFEINQTFIAVHLGVDRATISKLKNGEQSSIRCKNSEIYQRIFDPNEKNSPASGKSPEDLLKDLKEIIKELDLVDATNDLRDDEYKKFVLELLDLVKKNKSNNSKPINDDSCTDVNETRRDHQEVDTIQDCIQGSISIESEENTVDETKTLTDDCDNGFETGLLFSDSENESDSSEMINDFSIDETQTLENNQEADTIQDCIQDDVSVGNEEDTIQGSIQHKDGYTELAIPKDCKLCLCCDHWKGNVRNAYKSSRGVEGKCIMYDKNTLSEDGRNCERFYPNYMRVFNHENAKLLVSFYKK